MWIFICFDLPTHTSAHRKAYAHFKKELKKHHFRRMQYSVYVRHCTTKQLPKFHSKLIQKVPSEGDIMALQVSDHTYQQMIHIQNGQPMPTALPSSPLTLW